MSFRDRPWSARMNALGDEAEQQFERYCAETLGVNCVKVGLDRPPLQVHRLPKRIRYWPDYLLTDRFVEVQGLGRDQKAKFKLDKLNCAHFWNSVHPVDFYLWDSHHKRETLFPLSAVDDLIDDGTATLGHFTEGKAYFEIPAAHLFTEHTIRV